MVNLDRCNGSCDALDNLPKRICVPNKMEDADLSVFIMIIRINESKTLTKHISCECKCKFDGRKRLTITINVDVSAKIQEDMCEKKNIFGILVLVVVKVVNVQEVLLMIQ